MKMSNGWNKFIYHLWAPVYDATVGHFFFPGRKRAVAIAALEPGEKVLLVGVGTGADLPLLPSGISVTGIDLSADMLTKAAQKLPLNGVEVTLIQGDAQTLLVPENYFDTAFFNLILSVIPDPRICLRENLRALKPGGRVVVFDKFLPDSSKLSLARRIINFFSTLFGTDITRRFEDLSQDCGLMLLGNEPSLLNGIYRVILLLKPAAPEK